MSHRTIRIGTRDSKLALWQADEVRKGLERQGYSCALVPVKSEGDLDLVTPLYAMGVEGVFTRSLDAGLLNHKIDLAVHSMKDVPVSLARGLVQAAVLPRGNYADWLIAKDAASLALLDAPPAGYTIATGSVRRKAQWLHRYPEHRIEALRGNVQTRLQKLETNAWQGAIFAAAGLERLEVVPPHMRVLDWMLPAPAQGAVMVVCREGEEQVLECCLGLNDAATALCAGIERAFLEALMGGCATPISAVAVTEGQEILFRGNVTSPDGSRSVTFEDHFPMDMAPRAGQLAAKSILEMGADAIIERFKAQR